MLNRLFVIIGVLVICAIAAAFVVPRFIQWGDYRGRLQTMASAAFGTDVAIEGDIQLTLLPQPQLAFTKVRVGPKDAPIGSVEKVEAEFSLLDFLRDQYHVTGLRLDHPVVNFSIGPDGTFASGIAIASNGGQSNVSIADADVVDGTVNVTDARAGQSYAAEAVNGKLKLDALDGPFNFQGTAKVGAVGYALHFTTGKIAATGGTSLSAYLKADDDSFTLESQGALQAGVSPKYTGDLSYRVPPPKPKEGEAVDAGRGDFVLTGKVEATSDKVLLTEYTAVPDENRSATRLMGAAELSLGKAVAFNAVVSGGVVALPPRDATTELTDPPYELVRLLGELPAPPIPPIAGKIGFDVNELNLRAVSLRNVAFDAVTDTKSWTIKDFSAALPGGAKLGLAGELTAAGGKPVFAGGVTLETSRLDLLAALYRKPSASNPLFNVEGGLSADVALAGDTLRLSSGKLTIGGTDQGFDATISFGTTRELKASAHLTTLGPDVSAALGALLPDIGANGSFGATFPKGEVSFSADKAVLFGLDGTQLVAAASWEGGVLEFSKLGAADLGGAAFDGKLTAFGTLAKPELSGSGTLKISTGSQAVATLLTAVNMPPAVADFLRRSLPADLKLELAAPAADGGQVLSVVGTAGSADAKLTAKLGTGIINALTAPIQADLELSSATPRALTAQLGLGDEPLFSDKMPLHLSATIDGVPSNSYETHVSLQGGDDRIAFDGKVMPGDFTKIGGVGQVEASLRDPSVLVAALGAGGIHVPAFNGKAGLEFDGLDRLSLSQINASGVTGDLKLVRRDQTLSVTGSLKLASLDAHEFLPLLAGPASVLGLDGVWPDGPIDVGTAPRTSEGRIDVSVDTITSGDATLITAGNFGFDWDAQNVHLRNLGGAFGGGKLGLDVTICCSNTLAAKQVSGRLSLDGVALDAIATGPIANTLDAKVDASAAFDGTGESPAKAIATLTGTGSYTLNDFSAAHFDPAVFNGLGALEGVLDMSPEDLTATVTQELQAAPFAASAATGTFTIAGGVLRSPNLAIDGEGARIFGGSDLQLADLTLDARYAMSPTGSTDPASTVDPTSAEIAAVIKGPLWSPATSYDVGSLVGGMKIKANEVELALLEKRKAEADERARAAAAEQARIAAEQAAQDAAKKAAAEEAARRAAEQAARDLGM